MKKADPLPLGIRVMVPLGDVLYRGVIVEPRDDHTPREGMVCVQFIPPVVAIDPPVSIDYITCPAGDVTQGWF
jgi:hypothetical protein